MRITVSIESDIGSEPPHITPGQEEFVVFLEMFSHPTDDFTNASDGTPENTTSNGRLGRPSHDSRWIIKTIGTDHGEEIGAGRQGECGCLLAR